MGIFQSNLLLAFRRSGDRVAHRIRENLTKEERRHQEAFISVKKSRRLHQHPRKRQAIPQLPSVEAHLPPRACPRTFPKPFPQRRLDLLTILFQPLRTQTGERFTCSTESVILSWILALRILYCRS